MAGLEERLVVEDPRLYEDEPVERDVDADLPTLLPEVARDVAEGMLEWLRETDEEPVLEVAPLLIAAELLLETAEP